MACESREQAEAAGVNTKPQQFEENALSDVTHMIGVISGKGGVGKSLVTCSLACKLARAGYKVGVLDADITGPSVPYMLGLRGARPTALGQLYLPAIAPSGIKVMSANMLLAHEYDPVLWRGPVLAGALRQFWSQTSWGPLDYLLIDMPPGTGDVALTCYQSLPLEGVIIVTSPQDLVSMIVTKAVKMAAKMNVGVLGIVENMSYITCPTDGTQIDLFGPSHLERDAALSGVPALDRMPIMPELAAACDAGKLYEALDDTALGADVLPVAYERVVALEDEPPTMVDVAALDERLERYRAGLGIADQGAGMPVVDATPEEERSW